MCYEMVNHEHILMKWFRFHDTFNDVKSTPISFNKFYNLSNYHNQKHLQDCFILNDSASGFDFFFKYVGTLFEVMFHL
jgi:hypothetical protein